MWNPPARRQRGLLTLEMQGQRRVKAAIYMGCSIRKARDAGVTKSGLSHTRQNEEQ